MTTFQMAMKDPVFALVLDTFPGADDTERLAELKRFVRQELRSRVVVARSSQLQDTARATVRDALKALDVELAE